MKKILYFYGGPEFHPTEWAGNKMSEIFHAHGRFTVDMTFDLDALASLPDSGYDAAVLYMTGFKDSLIAKREKGLLKFVKNGGGFIGIHSAADTFRDSRAYVEMLNGEFLFHPAHHEFKLSVVDKSHYITARMPDFSIYDEMYHLQNHDDSKSKLLFKTMWQGKEIPMVYARDYGKGRVAYISPGHMKETWNNPEFQKILVRSAAYCTGVKLPDKAINCGILGYGPAYNMGRHHSRWIDSVAGLKTIAVCDASPSRIEAARTELPQLKAYFTSLADMLKMKELDLVVDILPHNLHAKTALQCINAGKHVVVEKPFCLTVKEADEMIEAARHAGVMLSVFHNRRWDADYLTIRDIIDRGLIGQVFHIECASENYSHPGFAWRSDKKISGGVMYDWGAHFIDWVLNLADSKVISITGELKKLAWHSATNEDYGQVYIKFENGITADYVSSSISAMPRPQWRILGTKGALATANNEIRLVSFSSGIRHEGTVKIADRGVSWASYYRNIADHLLMGEELLVKPEQARRVIAVLEECEKDASSGKKLNI
ncbi:MAG: ThuA domain-containing protein [Candidatus Omnitrophica bacterium]|nr:ThuA domain-containing protein [Candidatus Omnitrophota bacterium]